MSHLSGAHIQELYQKFGDLKVLDDIIRHRARDEPPVPILGYPRREDSVADYETFTGKQLDQFIDGAVEKLQLCGLKPGKRETIALLAPSNVDFVVSFFALSRLGFTILALSLRITPVAIVNLLKTSNCSTIIHGSTQTIEATLQGVAQKYPLKQINIPCRKDYDNPLAPPPAFVREFDREEDNAKLAVIFHSSGSTGLPKPIFLSHRAMLTHPPQGSGLHNFNALPWYHLYGVSTSIQAMWMKRTAHLYSTSVPLTADNLVAVLGSVRPEAIHSVPYVLGLIAEQPAGVKLLKSCRIVTSAGARTPDELGDRLVKEGVKLGVVFGCTEAGLLGDTMRREEGDDSWNYVRPYANLREHIHMNPIGNGQYECIYKKEHPALSTSNSDHPFPRCWHSRDVFIPHPSISHAWKYVTRIDDRINLINGEKVLPLPIEGRIRQHDLVREAVVFGVDQPIPGLLLFQAEASDHMKDDDYLDAIWPAIADANSRAEAFSQISKDMVILLPSNIDYPQTDKGSIIRAQVYESFASEITGLYKKLVEDQEGCLELDLPELEDFLLREFKNSLGMELPSRETDFFAAGIDSLKAIQMRRIIQKTIQLNGQRLGLNIVYEKGNTKTLAQYLYSVSHGEKIEETNKTLIMQQLIDKYSKFEEHQYTKRLVSGSANSLSRSKAAILTGVTGSLGAHILSKLVADSEFDIVYCLLRGENPMQRVLDSLERQRLTLSDAQKSKILPFTADLSQPGMGLDSSVLEQIKNEVSVIIHSAWPVNFNINLESFEPHIAGLHNLLQLSLSVHEKQPAQLFFCSSISTALSTPSPCSIPDAPIEDFSRCSDMGYAQSKLVGEHLVKNATRAGASAYVLRIGQISGDTQNGIWNDKEFIPSIIRSALTLKVLPYMQEKCSWFPVDILAAVILEISKTLEKAHAATDTVRDPDSTIFYNMVNPQSFLWENLLDELYREGLDFKTVPFNEWLEKLRKSAATHVEDDRNPAVKLVEYYENSYRVGNGMEDNGINFETRAMERDCPNLKAWELDVIRNGYIKKYLENWLSKWDQAAVNS